VLHRSSAHTTTEEPRAAAQLAVEQDTIVTDEAREAAAQLAVEVDMKGMAREQMQVRGATTEMTAQAGPQVLPKSY
jgi:hypothetical protein